MHIKFQGFAPDLEHSTPGIFVATEALLPTTRGFFRPQPSLVPYGDPVASTVLGGYYSQYLDGTKRIFCGTQTHLYEEVGGVAGSWVESDSGLSFNAPALPTGGGWRFTTFGNVTIAQNGVDAPVAAPVIGDFNTIIPQIAGNAAMPSARVIASIANNFVMLGNITVSTDQGDFPASPDRWWASVQGDYTSWSPSVSTLCVTGRLLDTPGAITACRSLGTNITFAMYKKQATYLGIFVGPPVVWQFIRVSQLIGAFTQESVVDIGNIHVFPSYDDFWSFDGNNVQRVDNPLKGWFFSHCNLQAVEDGSSNIIGSFDRVNDIVYWYFPTTSNAIDTWLAWNIRSNVWTMGTIPGMSTVTTSGTLVSSGVNNLIVTSTNGGTSWTVAHADDASDNNLTCLAWNGKNTFVLSSADNAVGDGLWYSTNLGVSWTKVSNLTGLAFGVASQLGNLDILQTCLWDGKQFVCVAWVIPTIGDYTQGKIGTSPDGINWTFNNLGPFGSGSHSGEFISIAFNGTRYVAIEWNIGTPTGGGTGGFTPSSFWTSTDLVNWTLTFTAAVESEYCWINTNPAGHFLVLADDTGDPAGSPPHPYSAYAATSADGLTWTETPSAVRIINEYRSVIWDIPSNQWIAVGPNSIFDVPTNSFHAVIATSPDGTNWTTRLDLGHETIVFGSQYFATVLRGLDGNLYAWLSNGGAAGSPPYPNNGQPFKSTDNGITWTVVTTPIPNTIPGHLVTGNTGAQFVSLNIEGNPDFNTDDFLATSPDGITWTNRYDDAAFDLITINQPFVSSATTTGGGLEAALLPEVPFGIASQGLFLGNNQLNTISGVANPNASFTTGDNGNPDFEHLIFVPRLRPEFAVFPATPPNIHATGFTRLNLGQTAHMVNNNVPLSGFGWVNLRQSGRWHSWRFNLGVDCEIIGMELEGLDAGIR